MATLILAANREAGKVSTANPELLTASAWLNNTMSVKEILALEPTAKTDADEINTFKEYIQSKYNKSKITSSNVGNCST